MIRFCATYLSRRAITSIYSRYFQADAQPFNNQRFLAIADRAFHHQNQQQAYPYIQIDDDDDPEEVVGHPTSTGPSTIEVLKDDEVASNSVQRNDSILASRLLDSKAPHLNYPSNPEDLLGPTEMIVDFDRPRATNCREPSQQLTAAVPHDTQSAPIRVAPTNYNDSDDDTVIEMPNHGRRQDKNPPNLGSSSPANSATDSDIDDAQSSISTASAAAVSTVSPSTTYKIYSKIIDWNGYSYTIRESLPDSTTQEEWDAIVASYVGILQDHKKHAGVANLTLTLDRNSKHMQIDIPSSSTKITLKGTEHKVVDALLKFHEKHDLKEFQTFLTRSTASPRDANATNAGGSITPRNPDLRPTTIDPLRTIVKPIPNPGNTCFIASVCQSWLIYQKAALEKKLNSATEDEKKIIRVLLQWIEDYRTKAQADLGPILALLRIHQPTWFNANHLIQQDANEFMLWLNQFMDKEKIILLSEYEFDLSSLKTNEELLKQESQPHEILSFVELKLDSAQNPTLSTLVHQYFNPRVGKDFLVRATILSSGVPYERALPVNSQKDRLSSAPQEFTFQIGRFTLNRKLNTPVEVEEILEIDTKKYKLDSIVVHSGSESRDSGHYVAYVRKVDSSGNDYFVLANDENLQRVSLEQVLTAAKQAYLLRYTRIEN